MRTGVCKFADKCYYSHKGFELEEGHKAAKLKDFTKSSWSKVDIPRARTAFADDSDSFSAYRGRGGREGRGEMRGSMRGGRDEMRGSMRGGFRGGMRGGFRGSDDSDSIIGIRRGGSDRSMGPPRERGGHRGGMSRGSRYPRDFDSEDVPM